MPNTNPVDVDIAKSSGVTIEWADGHKSQYSLQYLRDNCPCATCGQKEEAGQPLRPTQSAPFQMFKARAKIQDVEQVGRYALRFFWNDGHSTGIYSYEHLRNICPCEQCAAARTASSGVSEPRR